MEFMYSNYQPAKRYKSVSRMLKIIFSLLFFRFPTFMFFLVGVITMELKWPWCCATNLSARTSDDEQSEISAQWWLPTGGNMEDFDASFDFSVSENGV